MNEINMPVLIARFKQKMSNGDKRLSTLKSIRLLLTIVLVATILGFVYAFYLKAINMYAPAKFEQPLSDHTRMMGPKINKAVYRIAEETYPTFKKLMEERQEQMTPKLQSKVEFEMDVFLKTVNQEAQKELSDTFTRLSEKASKNIGVALPKFSNEAERAKFIAKMDVALISDAKELHYDLMGRYSKDMATIQNTLDRFRPSVYDNMEPARRGWHYLHLWLLTADFEILRQASSVTPKAPPKEATPQTAQPQPAKEVK